MSHEHSLYDTDPHFKIDPDTRLITDLSNKGTTIVQNDHNSERFTFELPRMVDGHDMSQCNVVEVHYINIGGTERHNDVYQVDDLGLSPNDQNVVICSWLLSQNATSLSGTLNFVLRFMCTSTDETGEAVVDYAWSTGIYTKILINPGIFNSDAIVEQYADVLEEWRQQLFGSPTGNIDTYSKEEIDELLSNPTITKTLLLTNDLSLIDSPSHIVVTSESDGWFVNNDGVSQSSIHASSDDMMNPSPVTCDIAISGHVKFTCISTGHGRVYVDGGELMDFTDGHPYTFEGEVKDKITVYVQYASIEFKEFKKTTIIKDAIGNIDKVLVQHEETLKNPSYKEQVKLTGITTANDYDEVAGYFMTDNSLSSAGCSFDIAIKGSVKFTCNTPDDGEVEIYIDGINVATISTQGVAEYSFDGIINEGMTVKCYMAEVTFTEFVKKVYVADAVGNMDKALNSILAIQESVVGGVE